MTLHPHHVLATLVTLAALTLPAVAQTPPPAQGEAGRGVTTTGANPTGESRVTPPETAITLLQETLKEHGRKSGFDADYGATNRILLARLADAIDLVETSPRPARQGPRIEPVMTTWRTMNRDFVQQLSRDTATLKTLSDQPIRYRLAEQNLYERIVVALRKNVACMRDMAGEWTSQAGMPTPGNPG